MSEFITLTAFAKELNMQKSNLRKYILDNDIEFLRVRTPETRNQLALALTPQDAEAVRDLRRKAGLTGNKPIVVSENGEGVFYVIQIIPELDPNRVKLGFSTNVNTRLQVHRTSAPTAELVKTWGCKRTWEEAAMASATRIGCKLIANEVFTCDNLDNLINRIDSFFEQLPPPDFRVETL